MPLQPLNIPFIEVTFDMLMFDKSTNLKLLQPENV